MYRRVLNSLVLALLVLCSTLPAAAGIPPVMPGELLGSTGAVGASLISIDPMTGAGTTRFPLGSIGPVTEIEFRSDGVLFGATGGGSSSIITIDPDTGVETLVGVHAFGAVNGLEFVGNTLYGAFFESGGMGQEGNPNAQLVTVDQATGVLTVIGDITDINPVRGLAYDSITGTMYGVGSELTRPTEGITGDLLFTIDLATGTPTPIGNTGAEITGGIEFGPDGTLYGGIAFGGGDAAAPEGILFNDGDLVTLDPATGAATLVGSTGVNPLSGLSFVPGGIIGPGPNVIEVPTLSEVGLMLMMGLLLAAGLVVLRRG
ncbi:MAG: IPTL-CTERM sorting domain-containing protein [Acidobacteriota bacterium]|nr:IPTL-CTERM sorting domain-containing protein [Acidobacteriota bacterium]